MNFAKYWRRHRPRWEHEGPQTPARRMSRFGKSVQKLWPQKSLAGEKSGFFGILVFVVIAAAVWKISMWFSPFMNSLLRLLLAVATSKVLCVFIDRAIRKEEE